MKVPRSITVGHNKRLSILRLQLNGYRLIDRDPSTNTPTSHSRLTGWRSFQHDTWGLCPSAPGTRKRGKRAGKQVSQGGGAFAHGGGEMVPCPRSSPARFRPARRTCAVCMCVARYLVADQKARPLDKSTVHELRQRGGHVPWRYNMNGTGNVGTRVTELREGTPH